MAETRLYLPAVGQPRRMGWGKAENDHWVGLEIEAETWSQMQVGTPHRYRCRFPDLQGTGEVLKVA